MLLSLLIIFTWPDLCDFRLFYLENEHPFALTFCSHQIHFQSDLGFAYIDILTPQEKRIFILSCWASLSLARSVNVGYMKACQLCTFDKKFTNVG